MSRLLEADSLYRLVTCLLHLVPSFCSCCSEDALDRMTLGVGEGRGGECCIPGSHGTTAIEETVLGRTPSLGHCPDSRQTDRHAPPPSLSVKAVSLPLPELYSKRQGSGLAYT